MLLIWLFVFCFTWVNSIILFFWVSTISTKKINIELDSIIIDKINKVLVNVVFTKFIIINFVLMTWTRLFYIKDINKAMKRVIPGELRE